MTNISVKWASSAEDYIWLENLWIAKWGAKTMVSHGQRFEVGELKALIATEQGQNCGALSFTISPLHSECVSLNALTLGRGVGTALVNAWENWARYQGIQRLWLITSNDNLNALRFYQKRGFRLCALYPGAIDTARLEKPAIALYGEQGIPIHDEIELEKWLEIDTHAES